MKLVHSNIFGRTRTYASYTNGKYQIVNITSNIFLYDLSMEFQKITSIPFPPLGWLFGVIKLFCPSYSSSSPPHRNTSCVF